MCNSAIRHPIDPLAGKIFESVGGNEITYAVLLERILHSDVVYLGEKHDNAEHHNLQRRILDDVIRAGKRGQIGFEFFSVEQTSWLMQYAANQMFTPGLPGMDFKPEELEIKKEQALRRRLGWDSRGEEEWEYYFSLVNKAGVAGFPVFGSDLPGGLIARISRIGLEELLPIEKAPLVLLLGGEDAFRAFIQDATINVSPYRELMFRKLKDSHCGWASDKMLGKLFQTWQARNLQMAHAIHSMLAGSNNRPILFVVGAGHLEHNMGIMELVNRLDPAVLQLNLGFKEVDMIPSPPVAYFNGPSINETVFAPEHEIFYFTGRASFEDPCGIFRKK